MKRNNHFPLHIDLELDEAININGLLKLSQLNYEPLNHDKIRFAAHIVIALKKGMVLLDKSIYNNLIVYLDKLSKDNEFIQEWEYQAEIKKDLLSQIRDLKK